jgi:drug/metabolite transporter (DMT)-like permease
LSFSRARKKASDAAAPSRPAHAWWFASMALGGLAFGLFAERRPFGEDLFAHPLIVLFLLVGLALLVLRFARGRPVPETLPERVLLIGCFIALAAFLAGNWIGVHGLPVTR